MGSLYLTGLADWLRAAGLNVVEYDGWKTRSRSSGGYDSGRPWGVMWHHTASSTTPANDASYMCYGSPDKPIANLLIARDGTVWVLGAGATNTNGKGTGPVWSRGRVPDDSMNTYAVGMEIANNGVGEAYPKAQIDAAFAVSVTLVQRLGLADSDICTHEAYAGPSRKIDPATAAAVQGPWKPRSCTSAGTWDLSDLIAEHQRRCGGGPTPTPTPEDDMAGTVPQLWKMDNDPGTYVVYLNGNACTGTKQWLPNGESVSAFMALCTLNGWDPNVKVQTDPNMFRAFGPVVGPRPGGVDEWGVKT